MARKRSKKSGEGKGEPLPKGIRAILRKDISRREFIKKSIVGAGTLALGVYSIDHYILNRGRDLFSGIFNRDAPSTPPLFSREAEFYVKKGNMVQCKLCPFECILGEGDRGHCRTRANINGKLYTLAYGNPCTIHIDPIEKKPLFHFLPKTKAFSLAVGGCNLRCMYCQNWEISQVKPESVEEYELPPERLAEAASQTHQKDNSIKTIAYTYSEPVAFYEYVLDSARASSNRGLKNVIITSGYINEKPLLKWAGVVDAIKIDLKGFNEKFYRKINGAELEGVLRSIKTVAKSRAFLEVVNLVVPTLNDNYDELRQMASWLRHNIGKDTPLHFSRFYPNYRLRNLPPTPINTLRKAREIALDEGLHYVYIGNVPHDTYENTYCPKCKALLIERIGYFVKKNVIKNGRCPYCGTKINGVWS